ncbi:MAG: hypothetical protein JNM43_24100 [Planctomycetaceae bacterium]|nr:hypothetical protein [Planctomycetaceae bacterium]
MKRVSFFFLIVFAAASDASCQEASPSDEGGIAIIEDVSRTWQENYLRLRTWQGTVKINTVNVRAKGTTVIDRELEFALDTANDNLIHFGSTLLRFKPTDSTEEEFRKDKSGFRGNLRTSDSSTDVFRSIANREQGSKLVTNIKPRSRKMNDWFSLGVDFDPVLPMWCRHIPVDIELKNSLLSWKDRNGEGFIVNRKEDLVAFTLQFDELNWEFSITQGGNPVSVTWEFDDTKGHSKGVIKSQFVEIGGVWVPSSAHHSWVSPGVSIEIQLDYLNSRVNEPLPDNCFSLTRLQISDGDPIWDTRFHAGYRFDSTKATAKKPETVSPVSQSGANLSSIQNGTTSGKKESQRIGDPASQQAPEPGGAKSTSDSSVEVPIAQALPFWRNKGIVAMGSLCLLCLIALTINWFRSQGRQK